MELERDVLVSPTGEVPVIEGELVTAIRTLADRGVGKKTIAREVGVAVNTVRVEACEGCGRGDAVETMAMIKNAKFHKFQWLKRVGNSSNARVF